MCLCIQPATAQDIYRVQHQVPTVVERGNEVSLSFDVPTLNPSNLQDAFLFYKYDGDVSYSQQRASYNQGGFNLDLKIDNQDASSLQYYFVITLNNDQQITYPGSLPQSDPARVEIVENRRATESPATIEYTILSPEPGTSVLPSDAVIAITLFYEQGVVDSTSSFQLFLDDKNVTEQAEASEFFLLLTGADHPGKPPGFP
ncbi:MAG: hypothetical protein U5K69_15465 [Balneolaceae bacterium]|nr:hypothetical protein [Balneolaceae bacterium]